MAKQDDSDETWISTIENLCLELNVDPGAAAIAKESLLEMKKNYTLDGDPHHWMACALYVACRKSITPTVEAGKAVEGNCVSLTSLLRSCNISLIQFFTKIKNWMDMASMSTSFKERITHLQHKFAVSIVLFGKFQPIFQEIFTGLTKEPVKTNTKSKKHKLHPCTTNAVYALTWSLYCCVKGEFHKSSDVLVDMYHLLLSCLDFVFANAFMAQRTDLINPSFKGLPADWMKEDFQLPKKPPCIISTLCEIKDGLVVQAATMKEYSFRPVIKKFFEKEILKGDEDQLGILDIGNFDANFKSLNNVYETYVLSVGEFDERIFLGEHAQEQVSTNKKVSGEEITQAIANLGPGAASCPDTPLTGRRYLCARRNESLTPVSEATNSLARLTAYLRDTRPHPSNQLLRLFHDFDVTDETILTNVIEPCNNWTEKFCEALQSINCSNPTIGYRKNMVLCLYYKVFEHILREERRKKPQLSLKVLLTQETYQLTVYACCSEIVLFAYNIPSLLFPRVLEIFNLSAFHFYKIIELIVQAVADTLSREVIKHLNAVEEQVLESMVWASDSPLWEFLAKYPVPASTDVYNQDSPNRRNSGGMLSPVSSSTSIPKSAADIAKKQLNFGEPSPSNASVASGSTGVKPGQSLLMVNSPNEPNQATTSESNPEHPGLTTPKKNNSLVLFFRKFYNLAGVRMKKLCEKLNLSDEELQRKMWTILEYSIMHQTQLMRDRHLDQILMCSVYVICKVSNSSSNPVERTFADIMRCYRQLPLADSRVYRSVLIKPSNEQGQPERGDLIDFYNKVYVQCMQSFALRFTGRSKEECSLSPLPGGRGAGSLRAQRVCSRQQLFVKPLRRSAPPPPHLLTYSFSRSPAKDLRAINTLVERASQEVPASREDVVMKRARYSGVTRKLHSVLNDRQAV